MPVFFRHSCDVISGLFSEPGCSIRTARGTKNFDFIFIFFWQPVQIHIHVQIAPRRHILCRRCRLQYEILSAPNKLCHTSVLLTNRADSLSNIGKTLYIVKRKICDLELRYFMPDIETC